ncbi:conserved hypothetical protein [Methanothrix thermoacetophila PT]|uniref:DUF7847 domain-containing protein n=2 Tax=Methanothrix TaxID=2222 RepID=A0B875_METTP|nr:conserved hypothetical protein [Methanothrix thermoacetophila PT]
MYEEIGSVIGRGFSTWKNNLIICVPFMLDVIAVGLLFILLFVSILGTMPEAFMNIEDVPPEEIMQAFDQNGITIGVYVVLFFVLALLVSAFFTAGATGMARSANATGFSSLGEMWEAGKRYCIRLFSVSLLSLIIYALCVLVVSALFVPFISLEALSSIAQSPEQIDPGLVALVIAWVLAICLILIVISMALAVVSPAIVVDSLSAISGIRASMRFFRENIFDVFLLWLVTVGLSMAFSIIGMLFEGTGLEGLWSTAGGIFSVLVIAPLTTIWWTRLYMSRTGKDLHRYDRGYTA